MLSQSDADALVRNYLNGAHPTEDTDAWLRGAQNLVQRVNATSPQTAPRLDLDPKDFIDDPDAMISYIARVVATASTYPADPE